MPLLIKKSSNLSFTIHLLVLCAYTVDSFHSGSFCCKITKDPKVFLKIVITLQLIPLYSSFSSVTEKYRIISLKTVMIWVVKNQKTFFFLSSIQWFCLIIFCSVHHFWFSVFRHWKQNKTKNIRPSSENSLEDMKDCRSQIGQGHYNKICKID